MCRCLRSWKLIAQLNGVQVKIVSYGNAIHVLLHVKHQNTDLTEPNIFPGVIIV